MIIVVLTIIHSVIIINIADVVILNIIIIITKVDLLG